MSVSVSVHVYLCVSVGVHVYLCVSVCVHDCLCVSACVWRLCLCVWRGDRERECVCVLG